MKNFEKFMDEAKEAMKCTLNGKSTCKEPKLISLVNYKKAPKDGAFEERVYKYFQEIVHNNEAGIKMAYKTENIRIDGIIEMNTDDVYYLEIKDTLSWKLSHNARIQFLLAKHKIIVNKKPESPFKENHSKPKGGIIVFKKFDSDWKHHIKKWKSEKGWIDFYKDEEILRKSKSFKKFPVRLLQLNKGVLGYFNPQKGKIEPLT